MFQRKMMFAATASLMANAWAGAAIAQDAQPVEAREQTTAGLEDIIVTATRRETKLQDTPLSIAAVSGEAIQEKGIGSLQELALSTPSLVMGADAGYGVNAAIRGIDSFANGVGSDAPVAFYVDGVYLGRNTSSTFGLANVERVEILRGPQGTLFGRNVTAGAVHVITKTPGPNMEAFAEVEAGNLSHLRFRGYVSAPIADRLYLSVAGYADQTGNWMNRNVVQGVDNDDVQNFDVRAVLRFQPTDGTNIVLRADYGVAQPNFWHTDVVTKPGYVGGVANASVENIARTIPNLDDISSSPEFMRRHQGGVSLTVDQDVADEITLTSVSAYRKDRANFLSDSDGTAAVLTSSLLAPQRDQQFSQEFRLAKSGSGPLQWLVGAYYYREKSSMALYVGQNVVNRQVSSNPHNLTNSYAAFGELTWTPIENLTIRPGLRYTRESKEFSNILQVNAVPGERPNIIIFNEANRRFTKKTWSDWSPKISVDYHVSPDVMIYGVVQKGFKSGGNNFSAADFTANPSFDPETVWSYEGGVKSDFFDRRVRFNLSAFYMNYKGLQVRAPLAVGGLIIIRNAANAEIKGLELETTWLVSDRLTLNANATLLDAQYKDYVFPAASAAGCIGGQFAANVCSLSGNRLNRAPRLKTSLNGNYNFDLGTFAKANVNLAWSHTGKNYYDDRNVTGVEAYNIFDAYVSVSPTDTPWSVKAWVKNLTNERYYTALSVVGASIIGDTNMPRTYGVTASARF